MTVLNLIYNAFISYLTYFINLLFVYVRAHLYTNRTYTHKGARIQTTKCKYDKDGHTLDRTSQYYSLYNLTTY